jgi:protein-S-isoprenylcysteine O-methyltransferase Ste14
VSGGLPSSLEELASLARRWCTSTSKRDFAVVPLLALLEQPMRRRRLRLIGLVPMGVGFALYRLCGPYRQGIAGGGAGLSGPPPEQLVTTGIYSVTRNPMYSGHVLYLFGVAILTSSPLAAAFALANLPWFDSRVRGDEASLLERFGEPYAEYLTEVPRWGLSPARLKALLAGGG